MRKRCVLYARASLDLTGEASSVERQLEADRKHAELKGYDVVASHVDNSISAYGGKERPGWRAVLDMIEADEVDVVVAWHLDRMTRSMVDLEHLIVLAEKHGVGIATVTGDIDLTTDVGRMVARILAAVARAEVERKAARQRLANEQKAQSGKPWSGGARPFGYTPDQLDVVPEEAEAIQEAAKLVLADEESLAGIARRWEAAGLSSSRASDETKGGWTQRGVKGVLTSPRYIGVRQYRGEIVGEGTWPAILDQETHEALLLKLTASSRQYRKGGGGRTPENLLTGIARCSVCDDYVKASRYRGQDTYTCKPHAHVAAYRAEADQYVESTMAAYLMLPDFLSKIAPTGSSAVDEARTESDALRERIKGLTGLFVDGRITDEEYADGTGRLRERLAAAERVMATGQHSGLVSGLSIGTERVVREYNALSLVRRRKMVEAFLDIVISPVGKGRKLGFDPEQHMSVTPSWS